MWLHTDTAQSLNLKKRGLTLVELLLAITIFSVLLAASGGLIHSAIYSQVRWGQAIRPLQKLESALIRIEHDVESAQPLFDLPAKGTSGEFEFAMIGTVPGMEGELSDDWLKVRYLFEEGDKEVSIIREVLNWRKREEYPDVSREVLAQISAGEFAFGFQEEGSSAITWKPDWDVEDTTLPKLVKLTLNLPAGSTQDPLILERVIRSPIGILPILDAP